jgi:prepilin-type N-terminal cleavage/methylation domain-containing protein
VIAEELTTAENHTMNINERNRYFTAMQGFTLIEAMMAVVVLGIAAASLLLPFISGATVRAEGVNRTLAARLASDLMEEILRLPFHDPSGPSSDYNPGPESGENTPSKFDNIDDYDGYTESQGQVTNVDWEVFTDPAYANFSRNVTCEYVCMSPQPAESDPAKCEFIRVTVQVNYSGKQMATVVRLVSE